MLATARLKWSEPDGGGTLGAMPTMVFLVAATCEGRSRAAAMGSLLRAAFGVGIFVPMVFVGLFGEGGMTAVPVLVHGGVRSARGKMCGEGRTGDADAICPGEAFVPAGT